MLDPRLAHAVAVARSGSFTAAAEAVGVTQSAITKSIADLERQVGFLIFHRTSRGVMLTEEGRDFTDRAARLVDDARELLRAHDPQVDRFSGVLRIGVCPASLDWLLVEPLARLMARYPRLRFEVSAAVFERTTQQLAVGALDVAIGYDAAFAERRDVRRFPVPALRTALFTRRGHPLVARPALSAGDLTDYPWVSPSESRPYDQIIRDVFASRGLDWREHIHVADSFPIVKRIVATSDAIAFVALSHIDTPSFQKRFTALPYAFDDAAAAMLCCAIRTHYEPKAAVRPLVHAIRQTMRASNAPSAAA